MNASHPTMTKERWQQIAAVLDDVIDRPPGERTVRLDEMCLDADLRTDVEAFLAAETEAPDFLDTSAVSFAAPLFHADSSTAPPLPSPAAGTRIGPYRLVRELGWGGMGQVFLAERDDGLFEQRVALKVLRTDIASEALRQRLHTERQILAQLNHPGIARVFDGGVSEDGRPYLVLEYVEGVPIDTYCEALPLHARLALFEHVCAAVHHAHRNLVVHRDLKPSNILVIDGPDGAPVIKLLDFGIAKLLEDAEAGAARTAPLTQTGERWMTPHYAAPEQVTGDSVTTSTDVYALGVLLYELLTGRRPFDELPAHDVARAVIHTVPTPPSAQTPEAPFGADLDTVVLKALRKDPARRYASAEALADDIRRYLDGRPVEARRPTWRYRVRKFIARNRWPAAAALAALFFVGAAGLWHSARITTERDRARVAALQATDEAQKAARVAGFLTSLFEAGSPVKTAGDTLTAYDLLARGATRLDTLRERPAVEAQMAAVIGQAYADLGDFERARPLLERAVRLRREDVRANPTALADALEALADAHEDNRDFESSVALYREALAFRRAATGPAAPLHTAHTLRLLAGAVGHTRPDSGIVLAREALALMEAHDAPDGDLREAQTQLATVLTHEGHSDEAVALFRRALPGYRTAAAQDSTQLALLARVLHNFANAHIERGDFEEAIARASEAVAIKQRLDNQAHQSTTLSLRTLAIALSEAGRYADARRVWQERLALVQRHLPPDHWRVGNAHTALGSFELWQGNTDDAERHLRAAHDVFTRRWPDGHAWIEQSLFRLGIARALQSRYAEAENLLARGASGFEAAWYYSWNHYDDALLRMLLDHYKAAGKLDRVTRYKNLLASREGTAQQAEG